MLLHVIHRRSISLDALQEQLGFTDPVEFLHALLGYRTLPDAALIAVFQILPKE